MATNIQQPAFFLDSCREVLGTTNVCVRVIGAPPQQTSVLVSNHLSFLDPIALGSVLPFAAIAKAETSSWPVIGPVLNKLGLIFVRRGSALSGARALFQAALKLRAGSTVLVYPEGTTTRGLGLLRFHRGIFGIARLQNVPIVPVVTTYNAPEAKWVGDVGLIEQLIALHSKREVTATIAFGEPIDPASFTSSDALAEATRQRMQAMLESLPDWQPHEVVVHPPDTETSSTRHNLVTPRSRT